MVDEFMVRIGVFEFFPTNKENIISNGMYERDHKTNYPSILYHK